MSARFTANAPCSLYRTEHLKWQSFRMPFPNTGNSSTSRKRARRRLRWSRISPCPQREDMAIGRLGQTCRWLECKWSRGTNICWGTNVCELCCSCIRRCAAIVFTLVLFRRVILLLTCSMKQSHACWSFEHVRKPLHIVLADRCCEINLASGQTQYSARIPSSRVGSAETGKVAPMIFLKSPEEPGSLEYSRQQVRIRAPFRFGKPFAV